MRGCLPGRRRLSVRARQVVYYIARTVYAVAFLLPGPHGTAPRGIDPRLPWDADLYKEQKTGTFSSAAFNYPNRLASPTGFEPAQVQRGAAAAAGAV